MNAFDTSADPVIILILGSPVPGLPCPEAGQYVKSMDFEAMEGFGHLVGTFKPLEAQRFESPEAAMAFYRTVPACHPRRPDGKPNRPLTAFTIELLRIHPHRK